MIKFIKITNILKARGRVNTAGFAKIKELKQFIFLIFNVQAMLNF